MRKKCLPVLVLFLMSFMLSACEFMPVEETLPRVPVIHTYEQKDYELATVIRGDLVLTENVQCTYTMSREEYLSFSVSGYVIESVLVEQGQEVKAGQLLATLESESLQKQLDSLLDQSNQQYIKKRHQQENLKLELDTCNALIAELKKELTATENDSQLSVEEQENAALTIQQQIESLQQKAANAQASYNASVKLVDDAILILDLQIEQMEESLKQRKLYAGIDGTITYIQNFLEGERSVKERVFMKIVDMDSAVFVIGSTDYKEQFPLGARVTITCKNTEYTAHVANPTVLGMTNASDEKIYLQLDQPDPTLKSRDSGSIMLKLDQRENVLYLDKSAIRTFNGKPFVYIPDENGLPTLRYVTLGLEVKNVVEIVEGLDEGDQVIIQ